MWPFAVRNAPGAKLCSVSVVGGLVGGSNVVTFGGTYSVLFMGGVDNHTVPFVRFSSFSALRLSSSFLDCMLNARSAVPPQSMLFQSQPFALAHCKLEVAPSAAS